MRAGKATKSKRRLLRREAREWKERLELVLEELLGKDKTDPLSPVRLQVIDRATFDALRRLSEAGLIRTTIRTTRHLYPTPEQEAGGLTEEELQKSAGLRQKAGRKLKMARVLSMEEMDEGARDAPKAPLAPLWGNDKWADDRFGLWDGQCQGCDNYGRVDDVGLCEECASKLERDLIRERSWGYSATTFGLAPARALPRDAERP